MKLIRKIKIFNFLEVVFPMLLIAVTFFLAFKNYTPGTWLTGWDNLHPEFNLSLNIERSVSAVWQEYQGLGLLGGMAHAADLPRQLILLFASIFIPDQMLRYFSTFLMLVIGPLGVYFFIRNILLRNKNIVVNLASFAGAMFYLNNLATVQYFYTTYESFVNFYGFFPWLLYFSIGYLRQGTRKNAILAFLAFVLAASAFYVQTLFVVFILCLSFYILETLIRLGKKAIIRILVLGFIIFASNFYWLAPASYFSFSNPAFIRESKINSFSTPEMKLFNDATGNIGDIASLKGFWFEYTDIKPGDKTEFEYLMPSWRDHYAKDYVKLISYFLFTFSIFGFLLSFFEKNISYSVSSFSVMLFSIFMLLGSNPPSGIFFDFIFNNIKLFAEAFRSVFTKFSIPAAFSYSIGLALVINAFNTLLKRRLKIIVALLLTVLVVAGTFVTTLPSYKGELIHKYLKIDIPKVYFDLFKFFDNEPKQARIMFFPIQTFWGWNYYNWGYRGSGFLWYGIKQPILDRAFDVWSVTDSNFYSEASDALYGQNKDRFLNVISKYNVSYVLVDESVVFYGVDRKYLKYDEIIRLLNDQEPVFKKGFISVYKVTGSGFVSKTNSLKNASVEGIENRRDVAFENCLEGYFNFSDINKSNTIYPFASIESENAGNIGFEKDDNNVEWITIPSGNFGNLSGWDLVMPAIEDGKVIVLPARVKLTGSSFYIWFLNNIKINGTGYSLPGISDLLLKAPKVVDSTYASVGDNVFEIHQGEEKVVSLKLEVGKSIDINLFDKERSYTFPLEGDYLDTKVNKCWNREGSEGVLNVSRNQDGFLSIETKDAAGCFAMKIGQMDSVKVGLLDVTFFYKSYNGSRPSFCIVGEGPVYKCENDDIFYNTLPSYDWGEVNRKLILDSSKIYWIEMVAKPSDEAGFDWKIDYKKPQVLTYPIYSFYSFPGSIWDSFKMESRVRLLESVDMLDLSINGMPDKIDLVLGGKTNPNNCDVFKRGSISKTIEGSKVMYEAKDMASVCDYVPLNTYSTLKSYILRFQGEGVAGRGLKYYLYNKGSERNDIEALLGEGLYDKSYFVLNWPKVKESSYVLNIEGRSFGAPSKDRIDSILSYEAPLDWIAGWRLEKPGINTGDKSTEISLENSVTEIGTYKYYVRDNFDAGTIVLSQSYDEGWKTYTTRFQISDVRYQIWKMFPFLFGKELEHVKVNGWGNGWLAEPTGVGYQTSEVRSNISNSGKQDTEIRNPKSDISIVIVYLPQYLEFAGFAILLLGFIAVVAWPTLKRGEKSRYKKIKSLLIR